TALGKAAEGSRRHRSTTGHAFTRLLTRENYSCRSPPGALDCAGRIASGLLAIVLSLGRRSWQDGGLAKRLGHGVRLLLQLPWLTPRPALLGCLCSGDRHTGPGANRYTRAGLGYRSLALASRTCSSRDLHFAGILFPGARRGLRARIAHHVHRPP